MMDLAEALGIASSLRLAGLPACDGSIASRQTETVLALADAVLSAGPGPVEMEQLENELSDARADLAALRSAETWIPVEMRWRLIRAGDVVLDPDGNPWMVDTIWPKMPDARSPQVDVRRGDQAIRAPRDPDQTVRVLVPAVEAAGIVLLREQLGDVRVLDRRVGT